MHFCGSEGKDDATFLVGTFPTSRLIEFRKFRYGSRVRSTHLRRSDDTHRKEKSCILFDLS